MNSNGNVVAIEGDSDSDDDRKIPATLSKKKANKKSNKPSAVADPMDTSSEDEDVDLNTSKEEKAFLKSIDKKEKQLFDSDSESD
jgi:hypothetical protein